MKRELLLHKVSRMTVLAFAMRPSGHLPASCRHIGAPCVGLVWRPWLGCCGPGGWRGPGPGLPPADAANEETMKSWFFAGLMNGDGPDSRPSGGQGAPCFLNESFERLRGRRGYCGP